MEQKIGRKYWTDEEDEKLTQYVNTYGKGKWKTVAENLGLGKSGSSCSQRWRNHLSPDVLRCPFTEEEKLKILTLHSQLGNQWAKISHGLRGRSDNKIKNFCNKLKKKRAALPPTRGGGGDFVVESGGSHGHTLPEFNDGSITFLSSGVGVDAYYDEQLGCGADREHTSPPPCGGSDSSGITFPGSSPFDGGVDFGVESGGTHGHTLPSFDVDEQLGGGADREYKSPPPCNGGGGIAFPGSSPFDAFNYDGGVYTSPPPFLPTRGGGFVDVVVESGGSHTLPESNDGGITFPSFDVSVNVDVDVEQLGGGADREYTSPPPCDGGGGGGGITFPGSSPFDVSNYDGGVYSSPPPFLPPCGGAGHDGTIDWSFDDLDL